MMIFEGDFVNLGSANNWLEVVEILGPMHIRLHNGFHVCASPEYIADYFSVNEVMEVTNSDLVLDPTKPAYIVNQVCGSGLRSVVFCLTL